MLTQTLLTELRRLSNAEVCDLRDRLDAGIMLQRAVRKYLKEVMKIINITDERELKDYTRDVKRITDDQYWKIFNLTATTTG